jgi:hypothetical protein
MSSYHTYHSSEGCPTEMIRVQEACWGGLNIDTTNAVGRHLTNNPNKNGENSCHEQPGTSGASKDDNKGTPKGPVQECRHDLVALEVMVAYATATAAISFCRGKILVHSRYCNVMCSMLWIVVK